MLEPMRLGEVLDEIFGTKEESSGGNRSSVSIHPKEEEMNDTSIAETLTTEQRFAEYRPQWAEDIESSVGENTRTRDDLPLAMWGSEMTRGGASESQFARHDVLRADGTVEVGETYLSVWVGEAGEEMRLGSPGEARKVAEDLIAAADRFECVLLAERGRRFLVVRVTGGQPGQSVRLLARLDRPGGDVVEVFATPDHFDGGHFPDAQSRKPGDEMSWQDEDAMFETAHFRFYGIYEVISLRGNSALIAAVA